MPGQKLGEGLGEAPQAQGALAKREGNGLLMGL